MKFPPFAIFFAVFLFFIHPGATWAQAICQTDSEGTCSSEQACTAGGCRDLVYCQKNEDCSVCQPGKTCVADACINYRCKCSIDDDCGTAGRCAEDNLCVRIDDPPECGRACLYNSQCSSTPANGQAGTAGTEYNCTFDEKHPYVGLCCPTITGEPEEDFNCAVGESNRMTPRDMLVASVFIAVFMGRIRRRSAGAKECSRPTRSFRKK